MTFEKVSFFVTIYFALFVLFLITGAAYAHFKLEYMQNQKYNTLRKVFFALHAIPTLYMTILGVFYAPLIKLLALYREDNFQIAKCEKEQVIEATKRKIKSREFKRGYSTGYYYANKLNGMNCDEYECFPEPKISEFCIYSYDAFIVKYDGYTAAYEDRDIDDFERFKLQLYKRDQYISGAKKALDDFSKKNAVNLVALQTEVDKFVDIKSVL